VVTSGGRYSLPLWRCGACPEQTYSEQRPSGWAWSRDEDGARALVCGGCRIRLVGERRKARKSRAERQASPHETHRTCEGPGCDVVFELGSKRAKRYCSVPCRTRANNLKAAQR